MARSPRIEIDSQVSEPRCNICKSSARKRVDRFLTAGFTYVAIAEELIVAEPDFKGKEVETVRKNVERHAKRHVNIKDRAIREMIDRRAREEGILVDEIIGQITTSKALYELVVSRATEQVTEGGKVRIADAIEAGRQLDEAKKTEYTYELERFQRQVWAISQAVKEVLKDEPDKIHALVERSKELFANPDLEIETTQRKVLSA